MAASRRSHENCDIVSLRLVLVSISTSARRVQIDNTRFCYFFRTAVLVSRAVYPACHDRAGPETGRLRFSLCRLDKAVLLYETRIIRAARLESDYFKSQRRSNFVYLRRFLSLSLRESRCVDRSHGGLVEHRAKLFQTRPRCGFLRCRFCLATAILAVVIRDGFRCRRRGHSAVDGAGVKRFTSLRSPTTKG